MDVEMMETTIKAPKRRTGKVLFKDADLDELELLRKELAAESMRLDQDSELKSSVVRDHTMVFRVMKHMRTHGAVSPKYLPYNVLEKVLG